jgi:hypothetical protein
LLKFLINSPKIAAARIIKGSCIFLNRSNNNIVIIAIATEVTSVSCLFPQYKHGPYYCPNRCVLGPDPQEGVFDCGATADETLKDWEVHVRERIEHPTPGDEVAQFIMENLK